MIHNPEMECMDRESMRKLQSERLIKTVKRCYENVPFYKQKMDELGVKPEDIKSIDDISKLPFTTKHDLRDEYPFGLEAVPHDQVRRIHASSGTTGKPVVDTYTENDLACWAEGVARCLAVADIGPGDTVQVSYGYGLFTGGLGAHDGALRRHVEFFAEMQLAAHADFRAVTDGGFAPEIHFATHLPDGA